MRRDLHLLSDIWRLRTWHPLVLALDVARSEHHHAVVWVSRQDAVVFFFVFSVEARRDLAVVVLNYLGYLVLHQTHPVVIRVLELQILVRPIADDLRPFRALVA